MCENPEPISLSSTSIEEPAPGFDLVGRQVIAETELFTIVTRNGESIPVYGKSALKPNALIAAKEIEGLGGDSRLTLRRGPDASYNCHGLAFVSKLGCICMREDQYLIEVQGESAPSVPDNVDDHVRFLLSNGGFRRTRTINRDAEGVSPTDDIDQGDVAIYKRLDRIQHSAIVWRAELPYVQLLSKLGDAGEYLHRPEDAPKAYGSTVEFWTDRKPRTCLTHP